MSVVLTTVCVGGLNFGLPAHSYYMHSLHIRQMLDVPSTGLAFQNSLGQEDLMLGNGDKGGITKEGWAIFNSSEWIEVGVTKGMLSRSWDSVNLTFNQKFLNWSGNFIASQKMIGPLTFEYREVPIGSVNLTGVQAFAIYSNGKTSSGDTIWAVTVNGAVVRSITFPYSSITRMQVGIETKDSTNYFYNGTLIANIQGRKSNGVWSPWTGSGSSPVVNGDVINASSPVPYAPWSSRFTYASSGSNTVVFSRKP